MRIINPKLNIVFALYLAIIPLIMSLIGLLEVYFSLPYYIVVWGIIYFLCVFFSIVSYLLKGGKINWKVIKNPLIIIALSMLFWMILTSIINTTFNLNLVVYLSYFLMFVCVYNLDKKWGKILLNTLIVVVAISCIMGFIDPYGKFMPGFNSEQFNLSLHFTNPNYSAYIISALSLVCFVKFNSSATKIWKIFYVVIYLIYATHLFMNGSFVPITTLFIMEIIIQIVYGVKSKRCQYKMLIMTLVLIPICFLVDLIPNIDKIRTCGYNYFLECIAVFDNIFNTNILGLFGIDYIPGANGWNRRELIINSLKGLTSSLSMFVFGGGAGTIYEYTPHNGALSLALDFGVVMTFLFISFFVVLAIRLIRKKSDINKLYAIFPIISLLLCYVVGSIVGHTFYIFVIMLGLLFKSIYKDENIVQ